MNKHSMLIMRLVAYMSIGDKKTHTHTLCSK